MDRPSPLPGRGLGVGESISIPHPSSEGEGLSNAPTLRGIALYAIENTRWVPERSKNRIRAMVEGRRDWVISCQRASGVSIALYVHRQRGEYLNAPQVNVRSIEAIKTGGEGAWFGEYTQALLGTDQLRARVGEGQ